MVPSSVAITVMTALFTLGAAALLFWGWRRGFFSNLDAQSRVIFEPRDWRVARPWETPLQRLEREARYGDPVAATPGEWGEAAPGRPVFGPDADDGDADRIVGRGR